MPLVLESTLDILHIVSDRYCHPDLCRRHGVCSHDAYYKMCGKYQKRSALLTMIWNHGKVNEVVVGEVLHVV